MTVVKINALELPPQAGAAAGDELVKRFTARLESLSDVAGFEGFELLRPTGENETRWFVYTRWTDQAAYEGWRDGDGARNSHAQSTEQTDQAGAASGYQGESGDQTDQAGSSEEPRRPVSMGATLLEFEVAVSAGPSGV